MDSTEQLKKDIENLKSKVEELSKILETHTHSGNDGSTYIYQDSIKQKGQQSYKVGNFSMSEVTDVINGGLTNRGIFVLGTDETTQDGFNNAQITLEHQPESDGTTNQTFLYGYRGTLYVGENGNVKAGESDMYQTEYEFEPDSLIGHRLNFYFGLGDVVSYEITGNSKNKITVNGTWDESKGNGTYVILVPIYFGSADSPWRRLYTTDTSGGGIRFGWGSTGAGQNGLLYSSGENLIWRSPAGTSTVIA